MYLEREKKDTGFRKRELVGESGRECERKRERERKNVCVCV